MKMMIVLAHPDPKSFNHTVCKQVLSVFENLGINYYFHDLYLDGFNPVLSLSELKRKFPLDEKTQAYIQNLEESQGVVIIYPDWWGMPPAILKGWIDRVFLRGIAFDFIGPEFEDKKKAGLLFNKKFLIIITSDQKSEKSEINSQWIWEKQILSYCGVDHVIHYSLSDLRKKKYHQKKNLLEKVREKVNDFVASFNENL
jgi:NAD(P)H dehydrogenase (quinone)